ncbi:PREDICTED: spindle and kinetochore-associated protein 2-like, partial [Galeopterus variegatus]|uniref:Protein FAM33A n=1 Tax=Galeopterus variegatus TaxID=482537 RepID=A0ABM0SFV3_GALVR
MCNVTFDFAYAGHKFQKKNPVTLLKELSVIKSRYQTFYARFKPVAVEQRETKSRICATLNKTMTMMQKLQKQTDLE